MSFRGSQSSQNLRLCMPLAKFSYADVPSGTTGPIPWVHLSSRDDLFVLVEPFEIPTTAENTAIRRRFKVLQDPNVHEDLDLSMLAIEARRSIEQAQSSRLQGQQPSITIIVKNPCVAMRYPGQGGQIRRFQVRFSKEEDFYETLKLFSSTKLPFIEAGASTSHPTVPAPPGVHHNPYGNTSGYPPPQNTAFNLNASNHGLTRVTPSQHVPHEIDCTGKSHNTFMSQNQPSPFTSKFVPRPPLDLYPARIVSSSDMPPKRVLPFEPRRQAPSSTAPAKVHEDTETQPQAGKKRPATKPKKAPVQKKSKTTTSDKSTAKNKRKIDPPVEAAVEMAQPTHEVDQSASVDTESIQKVNAEISEPPSPATMKPPKLTRQQTRSKKLHDSQSRNGQSQQKELGIDPTNIIPSIEQHSLGRPVTRSITAEPAVNSAITPIAPVKSRVRKLTKQPSQTKRKPNPSKKSQDEPTLPQLNAVPDTNHETPQPNENTTTAQQPNPTTQSPTIQHSAIRILLSDPNFARTAAFPVPVPDAPGNANTFSALSESERHKALESWMAQRFQDPEFLTLCKTLEGVWERLLVRY